MARIMRFTLYGSPHSLPTYKVALMLRLSGAPFRFRYVSFQKGMHKKPEFLRLSRWGQVPVLLDGERMYLQSPAIVEHLAETLGCFRGSAPVMHQAVREWLYWDVDVLFPPVFNCYGVRLGQQKMLPIHVDPIIADYHRRRAETALAVLDSHLADGGYLCGDEPTIADLYCYGGAAFAGICEFDLKEWPHIAAWADRIEALAGFEAPFDLVKMENAEIALAPLSTHDRASPCDYRSVHYLR